MTKNVIKSADRRVAGRPKAQCQLQYLAERDNASFSGMLNPSPDGEAEQVSIDKTVSLLF